MEKNCEILDRLKYDINEANKTLSKFQDGLEQVRIHIEEIEQKPRPFIPNSRTFNGKIKFGEFFFNVTELLKL